ncbi:transglycosylase SLT domain-containing protein [Variovorax sp. LARHSF232]
MARVPELQGPSVQLQAAPQFREQSTVSADALNIRERQVGGLGQATEQAGLTATDVQQQLVVRANALRVDDAYNQAQEAALRLQHGPQEGYTRLKGQEALKRDSGMPLPEEFTGLLDKRIAEISDTLTPAQRQMFAKQANGLRTNFMGNAMVYTGQQAQVYGLSVREASTANAANALVLNFSDPTNVAYQTNRIRANIEGAVDPDTGEFIPGSAQMAGKSAVWAKEKADEAVSGAHTAAIQSAMEAGNVNAAMTYRQKYGQQMTATDMLKINGVLEKNYETMRGVTAATQVMGSSEVQSSINPGDIDRLRTVRNRLESASGDFNTDGSLVLGPVTKSGERAIGGAQVMPSTLRDPGYGIKPADPEIMKNGTPQQKAAEIRRVGDAKLDVLVKMFNGDVGAVLGAYNWGEKNVKDAQKKARDAAGAGESVPADAWLAYAPVETRNYVAKGAGMFNNPAESRPPRLTLEQAQGAAVAKLGPNPSPFAMKAATDEAARRFEVQTKAIEQRKTELISTAFQELAQNGGNYGALSPKLRSSLVQHAPDKIDEVMAYGSKIAAGQPVETDWNTYTNLRALAATDPQKFGQVDLRAQFSKLAPQQREQLLDLQTATKDKTKVNEVVSLDAQLNNAHDTLKINSDHERKGKFDSVVTTQLAAEQVQKGRPLTYAERQAVIDRNMLATDSGWFSSKRVYEVSGTPAGMTAKPVPTSDDRKLIVSALQAEGIKAPTDAQILQRFNLKYGIR